MGLFTKTNQFISNVIYKNFAGNLDVPVVNSVKVFGKDYYLKVSYKLINNPELTIDNRLILIDLPFKYRNINTEKVIDMILDKFYRRLAENEIENIMEKTRINLKFAPNDYKLTKMGKTLGTILEDKRVILINPDIVKYNKNILEYVVLHEFCHLKYKTHGKNFYKLIEKNIPNYKEIEVQIKGMF